MYRAFKVSNKSQGDGAQVLDLSGYERSRTHQVQVDLSATPDAGTLDVSIRTPGAEGYISLGTINLVSGPLSVDFEAYCDSVKFTPANFDAGKTYTVTLFVLQR